MCRLHLSILCCLGGLSSDLQGVEKLYSPLDAHTHTYTTPFFLNQWHIALPQID